MKTIRLYKIHVLLFQINLDSWNVKVLSEGTFYRVVAHIVYMRIKITTSKKVHVVYINHSVFLLCKHAYEIYMYCDCYRLTVGDSNKFCFSSKNKNNNILILPEMAQISCSVTVPLIRTFILATNNM